MRANYSSSSERVGVVEVSKKRYSLESHCHRRMVDESTYAMMYHRHHPSHRPCPCRISRALSVSLVEFVRGLVFDTSSV